MAQVKNRLAPVVMKDRRILFRNFAGKKGRFNEEGKRTFNIILDPDEAEAMAKDGWNVKWLQPRDPQDEPTPRLEVQVRFDNFPPAIWMITSRGKTQLPEDLIGLLDWAEFDNIDLIINPSPWEVSGKSGIKAYLKSGYFTIREDELELKYADLPNNPLPDSARGVIQATSEILAIERGGDERTPF
jgi:hypothetical protein